MLKTKGQIMIVGRKYLKNLYFFHVSKKAKQILATLYLLHFPRFSVKRGILKIRRSEIWGGGSQLVFNYLMSVIGKSRVVNIRRIIFALK